MTVREEYSPGYRLAFIKFTDFRFAYLTNFQEVAVSNNHVYYRTDGAPRLIENLEDILKEYEGDREGADYILVFSLVTE
jgi:hypothetical protein